jgi:uncharacterized protein
MNRLFNTSIFRGTAWHRREFPRVNQFAYGMYYLAVPLDQLDQLEDGWWFGRNRPALQAFYDADHGERTNADPALWVRAVLAEHGLAQLTGQILLVTLPRVLGYVFNPVSFWFCHDAGGQLRAVLCEVNNTFGETHSYLCHMPEGQPMTSTAWLEAEKIFHVSPFLPRVGSYRFRFALRPTHLAVQINYHAADGRLQLQTTLSGRLQPYTRRAMRLTLLQYPFITLLAIARIHWQALRLWLKRQTYYPKPPQRAERLSVAVKPPPLEPPETN